MHLGLARPLLRRVRVDDDATLLQHVVKRRLTPPPLADRVGAHQTCPTARRQVVGGPAEPVGAEVADAAAELALQEAQVVVAQVTA